MQNLKIILVKMLWVIRDKNICWVQKYECKCECNGKTREEAEWKKRMRGEEKKHEMII